jgi:hypothetical protein
MTIFNIAAYRFVALKDLTPLRAALCGCDAALQPTAVPHPLPA